MDARLCPRPTAHRGEAALAGHPVVFFDGVCGLCNHFVNFVLPRDRAAVLRFAPLQGETARQRLTAEDVENLSSVVFVDETGTYRGSSAIVRILWRLGPGWRFLGTLLWLVPRPLRDVGYSLIARFRYRLFGRKETCRLPTPAERVRFLP